MIADGAILTFVWNSRTDRFLHFYESEKTERSYLFVNVR
jgi:hypothetical protein